MRQAMFDFSPKIYNVLYSKQMEYYPEFEDVHVCQSKQYNFAQFQKWDDETRWKSGLNSSCANKIYICYNRKMKVVTNIISDNHKDVIWSKKSTFSIRWVQFGEERSVRKIIKKCISK